MVQELTASPWTQTVIRPWQGKEFTLQSKTLTLTSMLFSSTDTYIFLL